jgi:hypothetical protein
MLQVFLERYADIVAVQILSSKRQAFIDALQAVGADGELILNSTTGEQVVFKKSVDFMVDVTSAKEVLIKLPPKEWTFLVESVQEHLDENREFPLDHSFEPYGAKIIPESIKDVVIETIEG